MYRLIDEDTTLNMIECAFITDKRVENLLCKDMRAVIEVVHEAIKAVPSITFKTGRWIRQKSLYGYSNTYECSICGRTIYANNQEDLEDYPYCHCGTKMGGEKE
jgi:hypothetical protein